VSPSPLSNGHFRAPEWHRDIPGTLCSDVGTPGNSGGVLADADDECPRFQQCSGISHTVPRLPGVRFRVRVSVGCIGLLMMSVKRMMRKRVNVVCEERIQSGKVVKGYHLRCSSTPRCTQDLGGVFCGKCHFHGPVDSRNGSLSPNRLQIRNLGK
jgi:hypothetical protein